MTLLTILIVLIIAGVLLWLANTFIPMEGKMKLKIILMSSLTIIIVFIISGILLLLVETFIPMDGIIKNILNSVVGIILIVWLLKAFGGYINLKDIHV
jgi:hypothetical protein